MRIKRKAFDALVDKAIAELPPQFARWVDRVPIIIEDEPSEETLEEFGVDDEGTLLGSYQGVALTHRGVEDSGMLPDQIMIFRRPLMEMCADAAELEREVRKTLLHELGHYAGLDEDDLEKMGYG